MAGGGLLVDMAGARTAWAFAGCVYLVAAALAVVLTGRIREAAAPEAEPAEAPGGLERIRALMDEIDETRAREKQRARADMAVLAPRDTHIEPQ
jgi:hypothetical protein